MNNNLKYYLVRIVHFDESEGTYSDNNVSIIAVNPEELTGYFKFVYYFTMNNVLTEGMNSNVMYTSKLSFDTKEEALDYFNRKYETEGIKGIEWDIPEFLNY